MVKAILDSRKTQTRRVVSPQPRVTHNKPCAGCKEGERTTFHFFDDGLSSDTDGRVCLYGEAKARQRDHLWVRETFSFNTARSGNVCLVYRADLAAYDAFFADSGEGEFARRGKKVTCPTKHHKWKPSIFMPRAASRITLEIINIRVERLQEISEEGAKAEGVEHTTMSFNHDDRIATYRRAFEIGWDKINAKRDKGAYAWNQNPWVFVIEFKKI
jgi:hypothetical protein